MKNPKVTIILTTFNRAHLIEEMLNSIQKQTHTAFECLVIDDNSTDDTAQVVIGFCERDDRFKYLLKPKNYTPGLSDCRNFGLDIAKGPFIVFCDDDDVMHPQHLETCLHFLDNENVDFVHFKKQSFTTKIPDFNKIYVEESNQKKIYEKYITDVIAQKIALASCTVMWKRNAIAEQRFKPNLDYAEEWEFYTRLILNGAKGIQINVVLYFNRKHPNSNTGEFYAGNKKRMQSKIEASKLIISNLNEKNRLSPELSRFFCWESVRYASKNLMQHLLEQSSLSTFRKIELKLRYRFSPIIKYWLRFKKKRKNQKSV